MLTWFFFLLYGWTHPCFVLRIINSLRSLSPPFVLIPFSGLFEIWHRLEYNSCLIVPLLTSWGNQSFVLGLYNGDTSSFSLSCYTVPGPHPHGSSSRDWKIKTHLPSSFAHPHPGCITAPLRLDYTNVLFTPPRSRLHAPNPTMATIGWCLHAVLWQHVILWYCAGINMKSHYGLLDHKREGGRMAKGGAGELAHSYVFIYSGI